MRKLLTLPYGYSGGGGLIVGGLGIGGGGLGIGGGGLGIGGGGLGICDGTDCIAKPIGPDCGGLIMVTRCPSKSMKY